MDSKVTSYQVRCLEHPQLNGVYTCTDGKGRYLQEGGVHVLVRHSRGFWGIGDGKSYLVYTDEITLSPTLVNAWKYLINNNYKPSAGTFVTIHAQNMSGSTAAPSPGSPVPAKTATSSQGSGPYSAASSLAGTRYEVFCPTVPKLNGVYNSKGVKNRYEQEGGGAHAMVRHSNGLWGVGDNKNYLVLADKVSESPTDITNWKVLAGGNYRPDPGTHIRRVGTVAPAAGTKLASAAASGAPTSHAGVRYEVHCPAVPQANGTYSNQNGTTRYLQEGGLYILARHSNGLWGVGDSKNYLVLADKIGTLPTDVTGWKVLTGGRYVPEPNTYIRPVGRGAPSANAPGGAKPAAQPSAPSSPATPISGTKLSSASAGSTTPSSPAGDRYEVYCPSATQVNGVYTSKGVKNRYEQEGGGAHAMVRHSNGLWGVGDNKNYLVLADKVSESPTDITNWKVLVGGSYRLAPGTYIRHVRTAPPSPGAPNGLAQCEVFCPRLPGVTGAYVYSAAQGQYQQHGGAHWLAKNALNGTWAVRDASGGFLITSKEATALPTAVKAWTVRFQGGSYACNYTKVRTTSPTRDEARLGSMLEKLSAVTALEVAACPIKNLNGLYLLDSPVLHNIYSYGDNDMYIDNTDGEMRWVITDGKSTMCTHAGPVTHLPPSTGWKCWTDAAAAYTLNKDMTVVPAKTGPTPSLLVTPPPTPPTKGSSAGQAFTPPVPPPPSAQTAFAPTAPATQFGNTDDDSSMDPCLPLPEYDAATLQAMEDSPEDWDPVYVDMAVFDGQSSSAAEGEDSAMDPVMPPGTAESVLPLPERCAAFLSRAQSAAAQGRVEDLRARLEAAREAKPKNFALVGALGKELKAAEEALTESQATGDAGVVALSAQERAGLVATRSELVAALHVRCEELERKEEFAALEEMGQLLQDLTGLQL